MKEQTILEKIVMEAIADLRNAERKAEETVKNDPANERSAGKYGVMRAWCEMVADHLEIALKNN